MNSLSCDVLRKSWWYQWLYHIPYTLPVKKITSLLKNLFTNVKLALLFFFISNCKACSENCLPDIIIMSIQSLTVGESTSTYRQNNRAYGGQKSDSLHGFTNLNSIFLAINVMIKNYYLFSPFVVDMKIVWRVKMR